MGRLFLFLACVTVLLGVSYWRSSASKISALQNPVASPETEVPMTVTARYPNRLKPTTIRKTLVAPNAALKPTNNRVPFHVSEGFAIAYGDLILGTPEQSDVTAGVTQVARPELWESAEIPYVIDGGLVHPERVETALRYFSEHTPVKFIPYQGQADAIVFTTGKDNCYSLFGRAGGMQPIRLSEKCQWQEIVHEAMHALGFVHEQSRTDRDQYVTIAWDNIDPKYKEQFEVVPDSFMDTVRGFPFDFHSVMLYGPHMFARTQDLFTMLARGGLPIDPVADGLSAGDIERLKHLYPNG